MTDLSKYSLYTRLGTHEAALIKGDSVTLTATTAALNVANDDIADVATGLTVVAGSAVIGIEIETTAAFDVVGAVIDGLKIGGVSVLPAATTHNAAAVGVTTFAVMRAFSANSAVTVDVDTGGNNWSTATQGNVTVKLYTAAAAA
jgi:hypothetical protein